MLFLCDLPLPIHGMSNINKAMLYKAKDRGLAPKVINTVPSYMSFLYGSRSWGVAKFIHSFICFFRLFLYFLFCENALVYRPINGGFGQVYDFFYVLIIRIFQKKIIIHHHSFNYLNSYSSLFYRLQKLAGINADHIVLGQPMQDRLHELYGIPKDKIHIVSNVAFFDNIVGVSDVGTYPIKIGHLANLCVEKGVADFVEICRDLASKNVLFKATIAGPFADDFSKNIVENACLDFPQIQYVGPLYGPDKDSFFRSLDVFVFPSHYCNEAEPLVLYEAAQYGCLIIGTNRGCMSSVIKSLGGVSLDEKKELVSNISDVVQQLDSVGNLGVQARSERLGLFQQVRHDAHLSLQNLFKRMKK